MNLTQARVRKPCLVFLGRFFRELSSVAGESSVFDSASFIHPTAVAHPDAVIGSLMIGCNDSIGHHAVIGAKCQDLRFKIRKPCFLAIGSNNDIREVSSNHRSSKSSNWTDYVHTAGPVVVHHFCHLGSFSFIGGGSVISQDVPKYMMVAGGRSELHGLNLEGIHRLGFTDSEMRSLRMAYRRISMLSNGNSVGLHGDCNMPIFFIFYFPLLLL